MTKILRQDGLALIVPDYREQLSAKRPALIKSEVGMLAKTYGEFVFIHENDNGTYEAAFSREKGFLLAESIQQYLKASDNFIYCELLEDTQEILFVVVKNGSVNIDTKISFEGLQDELLILQTEDHRFDFYVFGDIAISNEDIEDKHNVASIANDFTILEESPFTHLPNYMRFELSTVAEACQAANLTKNSQNQKFIVAGVAALLVLIVWVMWPSAPKQIVKQVQVVRQSSPYLPLINLMHKPGPKAEIQGMIDFLNVLSGLPAGWEVDRIKVSPAHIHASLRNIGTKEFLETLYNWADNHNIQMSVTSTGVELDFDTAYPRRTLLKTLYPTQEVVRTLIDKVTAMNPGHIITVGETNNHNVYNTKTITINLKDATMQTLATLTDQFTAQTLTFDSATFTNKNGLLSGQIKLNAVGY